MFCINKKSAGNSILLAISYVKNYHYNLKHLSISKMSWQTEKEKYRSMTGKEKNPNCISWETIPTWKEFVSKKTELVPKINTLPENNINSSKNKILAQKISIFFGDITELEVDAIVNAANKTLLGGGGVDGAIHSAAGNLLLAECTALGGCETGEAKITGGYKLPAKYVIHTVGPRGEKPPLLKSCYKNSLNLALKNNIRTIAFPCISTGIYGYPNKPASYIASYTVRKFLEEHSEDFDRIIFCLFLDVDKKIYEAILQSYFPTS